MSGYEEDHNLPAYENSSSRPNPPRPDLSSFFSALSQVQTESTQTEPQPQDVSAVFRLLANSYQIQLGETEGVTLPSSTGGRPGNWSVEQAQHLEDMIEDLMETANHPPRTVQGMPDIWFDTDLDRIPKKNLKQGDMCGICFLPFLDDKYPLVVRLPCNAKHTFDLECIRPWLKVNTTCPHCRVDFSKKKPVVAPKAKDDNDEEDEFDGLYA